MVMLKKGWSLTRCGKLKAIPRGGNAKPFECPQSASTSAQWPSRPLTSVLGLVF